MTLNDFINKRLKELGMKRTDLVNKFDIEWSTLTTIRRGKFIRKVTQERLAKALQCSQGDIQACMAEAPTPLRAEAEKPEGNAGIGITAKYKKKKTVMETVDKLEEIMKKEYTEDMDNIVEPEPEPAEVFQPEPETEKPYLPEYKSVYEEDRLEGEQRYRQKLKDIVLKIFVSGAPDIHTMEKIYADIGYALVKELAKGGETDEAL